ncbi:hypothetical protein F4780DRAFT_791060 [Xylariomycetidae sp. FL0641]|nr:hypothetical protein F4780DRAFT_791060 [Xylariomycetidae sp. FL0641]
MAREGQIPLATQPEYVFGDLSGSEQSLAKREVSSEGLATAFKEFNDIGPCSGEGSMMLSLETKAETAEQGDDGSDATGNKPIVCSSSKESTRKRDRSEDKAPDPRERPKKPRLTAEVSLPLEVQSMIISHATRAKPICVLDLVVPEWNICNRPNPALEATLEITRVVTYTRGREGQVGSYSVNFGHTHEDHLLVPQTYIDNDLAAVNSWFHRECEDAFYRHHTHTFHLGTENHRSGDLTGDASRSRRAGAFPRRGGHAAQQQQIILPYDDPAAAAVRQQPPPPPPGAGAPAYSRIRHLVMHAGLPLPGGGFAPCLWLSWGRLAGLRTLALDLRAYSGAGNTGLGLGLGRRQVRRRAAAMARHLRLDRLVLAGLQSYSLETRYDGTAAAAVEEAERVDGLPNWIRVFRPAVRPGGCLVLVDRLLDVAPCLSPWGGG